MNSSKDLLDAVVAALKAQGGTGSYYAAAKALGLTQSHISGIRYGTNHFGDDVGLKAAEIAGIDPVRVLVMLNAERSKSEAVKSAWSALLNRLGGMAACFVFVAVCALAASHSPDASAATGTLYYVNRSLCGWDVSVCYRPPDQSQLAILSPRLLRAGSILIGRKGYS